MIHPDGFNPAQPFKALFNAGTTAINDDGYAGWTQYILDNKANPSFKLGLMTVAKRDGGKAPVAGRQRHLLDHRHEEAGQP